MRHKALGKHGWSVALGLLLCISFGGPVHAAPRTAPIQIAIGNPLPNSLVGGTVTLSVAYNAGPNKITAFTIYVDDDIYYSRNFLGMSPRGIQYLELDTRNIPDGNHTIKVAAVGVRAAVLAADALDLTVRNGAAGGVDLVPPLVQFRDLMDGQEVSGKITVDLLAEDNVTKDLLVSIFVNRQPSLIRNFPPYSLELDTAKYLNPATGKGTIRLDAMAFDKAGNQGKARPLTLNVRPADAVNQTPAQRDPNDPLVSKPTPPAGAEDNPPEPVSVPLETQPGASRSLKPPSNPGIIPHRAAVPARSARPRPAGPVMAKGPAGPIVPETAPAGKAGGFAEPKGIAPRLGPSGPAAVKRPDIVPPAPVGSNPGVGTLGAAKGRTPQPARPREGKRVAGKADLQGLPSAASAENGAGTPSRGGPRVVPPPADRPSGAPVATKPEAVSGSDMPGTLIIPVPTPGAGAAGVRSQPPGERPADPTSVAPKKADPAVPAVAPAAPVRKTGGVKPKISKGQMATAKVRRADEGTLKPAPITEPMAIDGAASPTIPTVAPPVAKPGRSALARPRQRPAAAKRLVAAKKPAAKPKSTDKLVMVVNPNATPDADGKLPVQVYKLNPRAPATKRLPKDRSYRVQSGESLAGVAKKFRVTSKSIMVANGLTGRSAVHSGSVIKIPGTFDVVMNDKRVAFDVTPRVENGLPLAPFRQIFEYAGGVVVWYPETQEVRAANDRTEIKLQIGSKDAKVNQVVVVMDRAAFLDSGRTIVPISFMEKAMELKAEYDVKSGTIILVRK
jgi:LysM repeat protein